MNVKDARNPLCPVFLFDAAAEAGGCWVPLFVARLIKARSPRCLDYVTRSQRRAWH